MTVETVTVYVVMATHYDRTMLALSLWLLWRQRIDFSVVFVYSVAMVMMSVCCCNGDVGTVTWLSW